MSGSEHEASGVLLGSAHKSPREEDRGPGPWRQNTTVGPGIAEFNELTAGNKQAEDDRLRLRSFRRGWLGLGCHLGTSNTQTGFCAFGRAGRSLHRLPVLSHPHLGPTWAPRQ